MLIGRW
jgi:hypothetical protein